MSDIFEDILEEGEVDIYQEPLDEPPPKEWGVNFETGRLTGRIVEGTEAVKVWAWNALKTQRYRYPIYSWFYGHDFEELIGNIYSEEYIQSEIERMLWECLSVNSYIESIEDITYTMEEEVLQISCRLITEFGEEELSV